MKRSLAMFMVLALILALCACSGNTPSAAEPVAETTPATVDATEAAPAAEETETVAEPTTEEAASDAEGSEPVPTAQPEPAPEAAPAPEGPDAPMPEEPDAPPPAEPAATVITYPLAGNETLSFWVSVAGIVYTYFPEYSSIPTWAALEEGTGVHLEITDVTEAVETEQFQLMIASGNWPDFVDVNRAYSGGIAQAYTDEVVAELTPESLQTNMPDYWALLNDLDEYSLDSIKEGGKFLSLAKISNASTVTRGNVCRGDWLDDLNLTREDLSTLEGFTQAVKDIKATYDPRYTIRLESNGAFAFVNAAFDTQCIGYNTNAISAYLGDDGRVTAPWVQDEYRDFLEWFHDLYQTGVFYQDFYGEFSNEASTRFTNIANGNVFLYEDKGDGINDWKDYLTPEDDPDIYVEAINPVTADDGTNAWGTANSRAMGSVSITMSADLDFTMQYLNYFFTEPGIMTINYGPEGVTYELDEEGNVRYLELVTETTLFRSPVMAMNNYSMTERLPTYQIVERMYPLYDPDVIEAYDTWTAYDQTADRAIPDAAGLTTEETESIANAVTDICTYGQENVLKFMTGASPINDDTWGEFVERMYSLGMQECIDTYQAAYDDYLAGNR